MVVDRTSPLAGPKSGQRRGSRWGAPARASAGPGPGPVGRGRIRTRWSEDPGPWAVRLPVRRLASVHRAGCRSGRWAARRGSPPSRRVARPSPRLGRYGRPDWVRPGTSPRAWVRPTVSAARGSGDRWPGRTALRPARSGGPAGAAEGRGRRDSAAQGRRPATRRLARLPRRARAAHPSGRRTVRSCRHSMAVNAESAVPSANPAGAGDIRTAQFVGMSVDRSRRGARRGRNSRLASLTHGVSPRRKYLAGQPGTPGGVARFGAAWSRKEGNGVGLVTATVPLAISQNLVPHFRTFTAITGSVHRRTLPTPATPGGNFATPPGPTP